MDTKESSRIISTLQYYLLHCNRRGGENISSFFDRVNNIDIDYFESISRDTEKIPGLIKK